MAYPPLIFLAFANDRTHSGAYLAELDRERNALLDLLIPHEKCEVQARTEASIGRIEDVFAKYQSAVHIFHFSGHAGSTSLQLESKEGKPQSAFAQGLAGFIGKQKGVRLAFLNGCSTRDQVRAFHKAGIPAVIATESPIKDRIASEFAQHFYRSLVSGRSIQESFEEAEEKLLIPYPSARELYADDSWTRDRMGQKELLAKPYRLHLHPSKQGVGSERIQDWHQRFQASLLESEEEEPQIQEAIHPDSYLLVNRMGANQAFVRRVGQQLDAGSRRPQFFLIHGPDEEEPNSLVRRFVRYSIRELMELERGRVRVKKPALVDLPSARDFDHKDSDMPTYQLDQFLRMGLKIRAKTIDAREVVRHIGNKVDVAFLQHNLMAEQWHPDLPAFLRTYMDTFWDLTLGPKDPRMIVIFNVVYTKKDGWKRLLGGGNSKIEKSLKQLESQIDACTLIQKLEPVPKEDVVKWRMEVQLEDEELVSRMYTGSKAVVMRKVQKELKYALERHNERLGKKRVGGKRKRV